MTLRLKSSFLAAACATVASAGGPSEATDVSYRKCSWSDRRSQHQRSDSRSIDAASGWKTTKLQLARTTSGRLRSAARTTMGSLPYRSCCRTVRSRPSTCSSLLDRSRSSAWWRSLGSWRRCHSSAVVLTKHSEISVTAGDSARITDFRTSALSVKTRKDFPGMVRWNIFMTCCRRLTGGAGASPPWLPCTLPSCVAELWRARVDCGGSPGSGLPCGVAPCTCGSTGTDDDRAGGCAGAGGRTSPSSGSVWKKMPAPPGAGAGSSASGRTAVASASWPGGSASLYLAVGEMTSPIGFFFPAEVRWPGDQPWLNFCDSRCAFSAFWSPKTRSIAPMPGALVHSGLRPRVSRHLRVGGFVSLMGARRWS
mmetsp:Transcript_84476/g.239612  ORF Transcript_84476/g.239612 Transcript_84476/m.239612 type:complete len:367 (-) Transcript_84476:515-1615(-)